MSNPNRFIPYTNCNANGFVHSATTGCKPRWPKSQLHPLTPAAAVSAAARSGALPCVVPAISPSLLRPSLPV